MKKRNFRDRALMRKRMSIAVGGLTCLFAILTLRLSYIMIVKRAEYSAMAEEQWTSEVKIDARRGRILDRNGVELAVSANVYRIDFDLNAIRSFCETQEKKNGKLKTMEDIAPLIAEAVGMEEAEVLKKLTTKLPSGANAGSATLKRRIEKDAADKVKALIKETGLTGVIVSPDTKRYYPNDNFLAHVLGSTNIDGKGLTGIELMYNEALSGIPGMKITELAATGGEFPYTISNFTPPVDGKDVTLTIDDNIQFFAEKIASQALIDHEAKAVSILVMDPKTGEILAMANKPDFNPNDPYKGAESYSGANDSDKVQAMWRNRLVNDTFEPGSIFKVITAIAAMDEGLVNDNTQFNCGGHLVYGGRTIKCWKTTGHGTQTFPEIIQNSCNVGFMKLGEMLGKEKLYEYIKKYGFGQKSGIDLPGEAKGILMNYDSISETNLATISFGQTNTVNSVQFMAAFNAIANGGTWIQPHVMKEISHKDTNGTVVVDEQYNPTTRKVGNEETTKQLRSHLERVVTSGSAKATFIEGYHIGGKTGTAQKVNPENGTYEASKYVSSFVGMAPVDDPKITIMMTVDEPGTGVYYAGPVVTPYVHTLFTDIFNYMESNFSSENAGAIVRDVVIPEIRGMKIADAKKALADQHLQAEIVGSGDVVTEVKPYPGYAVKEGSKITLNTESSSTSSKSVIMPDVRGYSLQSATSLLDSLGIKITTEGTGLVSAQSIPSGELINKGITVKLTLNSDYQD